MLAITQRVALAQGQALERKLCFWPSFKQPASPVSINDCLPYSSSNYGERAKYLGPRHMRKQRIRAVSLVKAKSAGVEANDPA